MPDDPKSVWEKRVAEITAQLELALEEQQKYIKERDTLRSQIRAHNDARTKETAALNKTFQQLEEKGREIERRNEEATRRKAQESDEYTQIIAVYDSLHDVVKSTEAMEAELRERPDVQLVREQESATHAEKEQQLRTELAQLQEEIRGRRRQAKGTVGELQVQLQRSQQALEQERSQRRAEGWAPESSALASSEDGNNATTGGSGTTIPMMTRRAQKSFGVGGVASRKRDALEEVVNNQ